MSKEATGENGSILGSNEYWSRVNRDTFWGKLMRQSAETNYYETLRETGSRAGDMVEEIYNDLQEHRTQICSIESSRRNTLAKQVRGLYDVCRMSGSSCSHSGECIAMLNLSGFFSNPFSDDRAIQNAIRKIKNNSDFFTSECVDLIQKAADWSISFAAGSSEKKRAFLEEIAQGKGKDFLQEVLDSYKSSSGNADMRGKCGYPINSSEYLDRMERVVFRQDVPTMCSARWGSPDYDGLLRDALESIAHQLERDLERNERENNYITDETEKNLKTAISELERCGISTGSANSKIEKLAWFVGGDPTKIRQLQSKLNALHLSNQLLEDGVYGRRTDSARFNFMEELIHGTVPSLTWVDPLQSNWTGIAAATKTTKGGRQFSKLVSADSSLPLFSADLHPYQGNPNYYHINVRASAEASAWQKSLTSQVDHMEISKEAYDILKDFQYSAKVVKIAGRIFLVAGAALDALELANTIDDDLHDADGKIGKSTYTSAVSIGGSWAGGALGAKGGALAGAAIGIAILPGIGTAIGGISGGLILGLAGSYAGSSLGKWVIDITEIGE
ncbi:hypothetical protein SDC9_73764 [bioreactor metagenome]|uniref:Glycine zipper domain-containing protein n=1 Tax=bioreactor metagenome TaxID=1076179 RepID=A0A644YMB9_9ZZZZ